MEKLKLLIVEDDQKVVEMYKRGIKAYNLDSSVEINFEVAIDKDSAIDYLNDNLIIFDAAIVDLDLLGSGGNDRSGNEVIRLIKGNLRFPVFVISGTPQNLDEELRKQSSLFKVKTRGDEGDYLEEIVQIFNTGITKILNRNGEIEKLIQNIFWNHISTSLDNWVLDSKRNTKEKEESLIRYTILHMLEYLDESKVHPSEFYITRPVKEKLSTGDLISLDGNRYVVLTPACDFAQKKVSKVFLLRIKDVSEEINGIDEIKTIECLSKTKKEKLENLVRNNSSYFHFIPKHNGIKAGIIDFQNKLSIAIDDIESRILSTEVDRLATISMPFLKDLIARYSSYYARQGSPDFDVDEVINSLLL
jgi:hypothetical protein